MKKILAHLSVRQRITILVVALLAGGGIYVLVQHQREADFRPLFTALAPEDAAGIVQKLKETGVDYRLPEGGGSVLVPSARLADLRLSMAALGLPKSGRIGFELFDKVNLGATEFTEHINYRRALEGELERTITALAEVEQARVHLTFPKDSVFLESQQPAKASVVVRLKPGARLAPQNVTAIDHLVASAVEGLSPDAVSVLDMNGNLLGRPKPAGSLDADASEAALDYRHKIETDLLAKINATLEPLLGANKFKAGVSVECDFSGGEQSEEIFDPARSVMVSSQRTEDSTGTAGANGVPGTSSSLPRPTSRPGGSTGKLTRTTENITYQSSRTVKKLRMPAGSVRKMSLAVLVDQDLKWERDHNGYQRVLTPPPPEKLKIIHDLVAGVTGFTAERGDSLVIETLPFETTLQLEPPTLPQPPAPASKQPQRQFGLPFPLDKKTYMIGGGALGLLAILVVGAIWMLGRRRKPAKGATVSGPAELPAGHSGALTVTGAALDSQIESQLAERDALQKKMDAQALASLKLAPVITKKAEVFAKHLRENIAIDPESAARVLRSWIRDEDESTR